MFEWLFGVIPDPSVGAIGDPSHMCGSIDRDHCGRVDLIHQGQIVVPKNVDILTPNMKTLQIAHFSGHTKPQVLQGVGPAVVNEGNNEQLFSFTAKVQPGDAIVDGVRIDWTSPPDAARILVSPTDVGKWHDATGWVPTKADARFPGGIPQSQNVVFSSPELVRRIEIQMKDAPASATTQFGIDQVSLITNSNDKLATS